MQEKNYYIFGIIGIVILGLGIFLFSSRGSTQEVDVTASPGLGVGIVDSSVTPPDLERDLVFSESFPQEAKIVLVGRIEGLRSQLNENPVLFGAWLDLALAYKSMEDYEGAREVWEYLTEAAPKNSVSFHNLGNLYHLYLQEYEKSEEYYQKAIELEPAQALYYTALHELYIYSYKTETTAAEDILKEGLDQLPNNVNFLTSLARYYRENGDVIQAREHFELARKQADLLGNTALSAELTGEIERL